jgi:hypothetical protein
VVSVKTLLARVAMLCASACVASAGCTHTTAFVKNEVCDSEMRTIDRCWTIGGAFSVRPGLGPDGSSILYYAGTGRPSGFDNSAAFLAIVKPGETYTFSAYIDGSDRLDVPPYVFLSAVNGSWTGASVYQAGKGRVSTVFTIPSASRTTLVRGVFATENGTYPVGRGAIFSQPQLEASDRAQAYAPSDDTAWNDGPTDGNLVVGSEAAKFAQYWTFGSTVQAERKLGPQSNDAVVYRGNGSPSGFDTSATFIARVRAGSAYTFSAYVDGSSHAGTPPYVFLTALDGTWQGAHLYQSDRGRIFTTFDIPAGAKTTLVRGTFSTENGTYPIRSMAAFAQPQLESGDFPHAYAPSDDTVLSEPPGGNLIPSSEELRAPAWTLAGGMTRIPHEFNGTAAEFAYRGEGKASGFGVTASTHVAVRPGSTYTLSAYVDGSSHVGTPSYLWVLPVNGTWAGAHTYQADRGLTFLTFTVPADSGSTCLDIEFSTQNGAYPRGRGLIIARPQLAAGGDLHRYVPGIAAVRCSK